MATRAERGPVQPVPFQVPGDWVLKNQDDTHFQYIDPAGQVHLVSKATGAEETPRGYKDKIDARPATIEEIRNGIRENVGADPVGGGSTTNTPEFRMLADAATGFGQNYDQDRRIADESRGMDLDTISRLRAAEEGKTPSAAEALMRKAIDQNAGQALGLASTLGGSNPGMALRAGLEQQQAAGSRSAADIAALRAKEMDAARALLAEQTAKGRAVDESSAVATGNTAAGLAAAPYSAVVQDKAADAAREAALLQAGGTAIASDIRGKTDIQPSPEMADTFLSGLKGGPAPTAADPRSIEQPGAGRAADDFLSTLHPQSFKYKNPDGVNKAPGTRMGVMAQDLPDHDVVTGPDGKKWISADVISDVLAGLGRVNEKVDAKTGASGRGGKAMARRPAPMPAQEPQQPQEVMIPQSAVHDYLAGLGIVPP